MAKQNMYPVAWRKEFDIFQNFQMGLNTKAANESLSERELPYAQNINIGQRGTIERRTGMTMIRDNSALAGNAQGFFRYFNSDGTFKDIIAKGGYLYINGVAQTITGFTGAFQTDRDVNAVQYKDSMYIATGTVLVVYDGTTFSVLNHYKPDCLEAMYVGLNGLEATPEDFIKDRTSVVESIDGVIFEQDIVNPDGSNTWSYMRYGLVNKAMRARAVVAKPDGETLDFKFEKRNSTDKEGSWPILQDWSTSNTFIFTPNKEGIIQLKVSIRKHGTTALLQEYIVPKYMVKSTLNPEDVGIHSPTIHQCNQIFVYWERLYLYGDPVEKDVLYASDVQNFEYFPLSNTIRFENDRKEGISTVARFRDNLIVFTESTTQVLGGKFPAEWSRQMVNSAIGCIAPKSVQSVDNALIFLSKDGVFRLKSTTFVENNMNVERLDFTIQNLTTTQDKKACSVIFDSQYHLIFPSIKQRLRFYYISGAWVLDKGNHMDIETLFVIDGDLYGQKHNGTTLKFDDTTYQDMDDIFEAVAELKGMSFGEPYHPKKLKEAQVTIEEQTVSTSATIEGFVEDAQVLNEVINISATTKTTNDPTERLTNIYKLKMTGKGNYVKMRVRHADNKPFVFVGMGFIYKVKKP